MTDWRIHTIVEENRIRNKKRKDEENFNPITGENCFSIPRTHVHIEGLSLVDFWAPNEMFINPIFKELAEVGDARKYLEMKGCHPELEIDYLRKEVDILRHKTDFEYVAFLHFKIKDKNSDEEIPFLLNYTQKLFLKEFETKRLKGLPIRAIVLKFSQGGGGSTFFQLYMAWIQLFIHKNWNSVICAHVENASINIKGMYNTVLSSFPAYLVGETKEEFLKLSPYNRSTKTSIINQRQCRITIGSAERPDGVKSISASMLHCSEVGSWKKTKGKTPEQLVATLGSRIPSIPDTIIVYESTANGINFFSKEWGRAISGKSSFTPIFVPWMFAHNYQVSMAKYWEAENYQIKNENEGHSKLINSLDEYEKNILWDNGATLEQIAWYRLESKKYPESWIMKQENPSMANEAFQTSGRRKFNAIHVAKLREGCVDPVKIGNIYGKDKRGRDSLVDLKFTEEEFSKNNDNKLLVWRLPDGQPMRYRYVVSVDIGGNSSAADWSVITVHDRYLMTDIGGRLEKIARWRGHIEHANLAWMGAQIAMFYDEALLVFESNTFETNKTEGDHLEYILDELGGAYRNLYCRNSSEVIRDGVPHKWGLHINSHTKPLVMDTYDIVLATDGYLEKDKEVCDELDTYEVKENGSLGAVDGFHDDLLMSNGIGIYVCTNLKYLPRPEFIVDKPVYTNKVTGLASF
jgi:hypothetical protein